jgi:hypothetical protein
MDMSFQVVPQFVLRPGPGNTPQLRDASSRRPFFVLYSSHLV